MNNCEYYQRLLSKQADEPLTREEADELAQHLIACPTCLAFSESVTEVKGILEDSIFPLPEKPHKTESRSFITSLWNMKIKLPMPIAAAALIIIAISIVLNISNNLAETPPLPEQPAVNSGESYQMVYMEPQPAKKISPNINLKEVKE